MSIRKPVKKAVALEYAEHSAPRVVAQAEGEMAELMAKAAEEMGVPAIQDAQLSEVLSQLRLNDEIPEDLYVSVAVVLAWAYWLSDKVPTPRSP